MNFSLFEFEWSRLSKRLEALTFGNEHEDYSLLDIAKYKRTGWWLCVCFVWLIKNGRWAWK